MFTVWEVDGFQRNLIQCSTTFAKDTFSVISNLNLPHCDAGVLSLVLEKNMYLCIVYIMNIILQLSLLSFCLLYLELSKLNHLVVPEKVC